MSTPSPFIIPPSREHTHTIVFLHGRGDTARNFASSLDLSNTSTSLTFRGALPLSIRWVFPQTVLRRVANSPGQPMVSQWFDVWNVNDFSDHEELQAAGLRESVTMIRELLAAEAALLGGRWDHIMLMGISQGAATSVHTLLNLNLDTLLNKQTVQGPRRLGAFIGFSCRMPFPNRSVADTRKVLGLNGVPSNDEVIRNTPMLLEHCRDDPLVLLEKGRALRDQLRGFGASVEWREYPTGGHWFNSPRGMDDVVEFLRTVCG